MGSGNEANTFPQRSFSEGDSVCSWTRLSVIFIFLYCILVELFRYQYSFSYRTHQLQKSMSRPSAAPKNNTNYHLKVLADTPEWALAASPLHLSCTPYLSDAQPHCQRLTRSKNVTKISPSSSHSQILSSRINGTDLKSTKPSAGSRTPKQWKSLKIKFDANRYRKRKMVVSCKEMQRLDHLISKNRHLFEEGALRRYQEQSVKVAASVKEYLGVLRKQTKSRRSSSEKENGGQRWDTPVCVRMHSLRGD